MNSRRLLALLCTAAILGTISGCGKDDTTESDSTPSNGWISESETTSNGTSSAVVDTPIVDNNAENSSSGISDAAEAVTTDYQRYESTREDYTPFWKNFTPYEGALKGVPRAWDESKEIIISGGSETVAWQGIAERFGVADTSLLKYVGMTYPDMQTTVSFVVPVTDELVYVNNAEAIGTPSGPNGYLTYADTGDFCWSTCEFVMDNAVTTYDATVSCPGYTISDVMVDELGYYVLVTNNSHVTDIPRVKLVTLQEGSSSSARHFEVSVLLGQTAKVYVYTPPFELSTADTSTISVFASVLRPEYWDEGWGASVIPADNDTVEAYVYDAGYDLMVTLLNKSDRPLAVGAVLQGIYSDGSKTGIVPVGHLGEDLLTLLPNGATTYAVKKTDLMGGCAASTKLSAYQVLPIANEYSIYTNCGSESDTYLANMVFDCDTVESGWGTNGEDYYLGWLQDGVYQLAEVSKYDIDKHYDALIASLKAQGIAETDIIISGAEGSHSGRVNTFCEITG